MEIWKQWFDIVPISNLKLSHNNRYYLLQASLIILSAVLLSPHNLINFKMCAGSVLSESLALSRPATKNTPDVVRKLGAEFFVSYHSTPILIYTSM